MDKFGDSAWKVSTLERDSICGCTYNSCWLYQWFPTFRSNCSLPQLPFCSDCHCWHVWKIPWHTGNKKLKKARDKLYFFPLNFSILVLPFQSPVQHSGVTGISLAALRHLLLGAAAHLPQNTSACHISHYSLFLLWHFFWVKFTVLDQRNIKDHLFI